MAAFRRVHIAVEHDAAVAVATEISFCPPEHGVFVPFAFHWADARFARRIVANCDRVVHSPTPNSALMRWMVSSMPHAATPPATSVPRSPGIVRIDALNEHGETVRVRVVTDSAPHEIENVLRRGAFGDRFRGHVNKNFIVFRPGDYIERTPNQSIQQQKRPQIGAFRKLRDCGI